MRKRLLVALSLGWIFNYAHRMALPPLIPMIVAELGITNAEAGLLMTALFLPYALVQVPAGYVGERIGRKHVIAISILGYSISSGLMMIANAYWHLLLLRALYGIFAGLYYAPATALISEAYGDKKGSALGVFMIGPPIGSGLAPLVALPVALHFGWRYAFPVIALLSLPVAFLLISGEEKGGARNGVRISVSRKALPLSVANFLALSAFFGLLTFLVSFLVNGGTSTETASLVYSAFSFLGIAGSLVGGVLYDRFRRKSVPLVLGLNVVLTLMLAVTASPWAALPLGITFYSVGPIITALTAELAGKTNLGPTMGFVNMVGFFGATVGPYIVGKAIDLFGYSTAFLSIPTMYLAALLVAQASSRRNDHSAL